MHCIFNSTKARHRRSDKAVKRGPQQYRVTQEVLSNGTRSDDLLNAV